MNTMKPNALGATWDEILINWYGRINPTPISERAGVTALGNLEVMMPQYLNQVAEGSSRGIAFIDPLFEMGLVLEYTKCLRGFANVLERLQKGEESSYSELTLAAALSKLGHTVELEPDIYGRRPDIGIRVESGMVYVEVIAPDKSNEMKSASLEIANLAEQLMESSKGLNVDLHLITDQIQEVAGQVRKIILQGNGTSEIQDIGFLRVEEFQPTVTAFDSPRRQSGARIFHSRLQTPTLTEPGSRVGIEVQISDERVQRLFSGELKHFFADQMNVLAIDLTMVCGDLMGWISLIKRRFQPEMNTRVGGVLLFGRFVESTGCGWNVTYLNNPFASKPISEETVQSFSALKNVKLRH